ARSARRERCMGGGAVVLAWGRAYGAAGAGGIRAFNRERASPRVTDNPPLPRRRLRTQHLAARPPDPVLLRRLRAHEVLDEVVPAPAHHVVVVDAVAVALVREDD